MILFNDYTVNKLMFITDLCTLKIHLFIYQSDIELNVIANTIMYMY